MPPRNIPSRELAVANQQVSELETRSREMLTDLKAAQSVRTPTAKPNDAPEIPPLPNANEMMQRTLETLRL